MRVLLVCSALTLLVWNQAQAIHQKLLALGSPNLSGEYPMAALIQGSDGALYGTTSSGGVYSNGTVFKISTNITDWRVLRSFGASSGDARKPRASLVQGSDGALYGTTTLGGAGNAGTVFKLRTDGGDYTLLHSFTKSGVDGWDPEAGVLQASDGRLYGTTYSGGASNFGTIFRLQPDGGGYTILHNFGVTIEEGRNPRARLLQGADGGLYGTTSRGGAYTNFSGEVYHDYGTIFKLNPDGSGYTRLYNFTGFSPDGVSPYGGLVQGPDGTLYGTTYWGGWYAQGSVFKINPDGSGYGRLSSFSSSGGGMNPGGELVLSPDGNLYGTTYNGGTNNAGTAFRLRPTFMGTTILHHFGAGTQDGRSPAAGLVRGHDGALYGIAFSGGVCSRGTIFRLNTTGAVYTSLYSFGQHDLWGWDPYSGLLQGQDGALYGTTRRGGLNECGTVFKLSPDGSGGTLLYNFRNWDGDGRNPYATLVQGQDGTLYGTTASGGTNGAGTVFKLATNGTGYLMLHSFNTNSTDGRQPYAGLLQGQGAALYGTTAYGGTNGAGAVFKLTTNGTGYEVLHSFRTNNADGQNPRCELVQGRDGALYGTTLNGGANGYGVVFKLSANGGDYSLLHTFQTGGGDAYAPGSGLLQGPCGALYGTTILGGADGYGAVFKLSTNGTDYHVLYSFPGLQGRPRWQPVGPLQQGRDGALYGATCNGGTQDLGALFRLTADGTAWTLLYSFSTNSGNGINPRAGLTQGRDGAWYGTTSMRGGWGGGSVFRLALPELQCAPMVPGGAFCVSLVAPPSQTYRIEASTNLVHWVAVSTLTNVTGVVEFNDSAVSNSPRRFYRGVWVPQ